MQIFIGKNNYSHKDKATKIFQKNVFQKLKKRKRQPNQKRRKHQNQFLNKQFYFQVLGVSMLTASIVLSFQSLSEFNSSDTQAKSQDQGLRIVNDFQKNSDNQDQAESLLREYIPPNVEES